MPALASNLTISWAGLSSINPALVMEALCAQDRHDVEVVLRPGSPAPAQDVCEGTLPARCGFPALVCCVLQVAPLFSATWEAAASQQASQDADAAAGTLGSARPAASLGATQHTQVRDS